MTLEKRKLLAVIIVVSLATALIASCRLNLGYVPSLSMFPTLQVGDFPIVRQDAYENGRVPQRGDIVVFMHDGERMCKRVVGLPGERVVVGLGNVLVAGVVLSEPYLNPSTSRSKQPLEGVLLRDTYLLMGDNRGDSIDSREFGPVVVSDIKGKVVGIVRHFRFIRVNSGQEAK